jgi:hypothetical protein
MNLTPQQKAILDARYCMWRLEMWGLGYGTYNEIDAAVSRGELKPFVIPEKPTQDARAGGAPAD